MEHWEMLECAQIDSDEIIFSKSLQIEQIVARAKEPMCIMRFTDEPTKKKDLESKNRKERAKMEPASKQ